jgi:hypothetical protein
MSVNRGTECDINTSGLDVVMFEDEVAESHDRHRLGLLALEGRLECSVPQIFCRSVTSGPWSSAARNQEHRGYTAGRCHWLAWRVREER